MFHDDTAQTNITSTQAAQILKVSKSTFYRLIKDYGILPIQDNGYKKTYNLKEIQILKFKLEEHEKKRKTEIAKKRARGSYIYNLYENQKPSSTDKNQSSKQSTDHPNSLNDFAIKNTTLVSKFHENSDNIKDSKKLKKFNKTVFEKPTKNTKSKNTLHRLSNLGKSLRLKKKRAIPFLLGLLVILLPIIYFSLRNPSNEVQAGWFNESWTFRKKLVIDNSKVSGSTDLTDFPILVSLSSDTDLSANAQADGDDIVFTGANGEKLDHEIESYSSGTLVAWVRIPTLYATEDTVIYMYYGNPSARNQENPKEVWDKDFKVVQHLNETSGQHYDSTKYANDSIVIDVTTQGNAVGKIGGADDFVSASNNYVEFADSNSLNIGSGNATWEAWIEWNDNNTSGIMSHSNGVSASDGWWWSAWGSATDALNISMNDTDHTSNSDSWVTGQLYHVVAVKSGTTISFYKNGVSIGSANNSQSINDSAATLKIGRESNTYDDAYFDGIIDEVRFSTATRSADWIATQYNTQNSPATFYSTGTQEKGQGPVGYWKFDEGYGDIVNDSGIGKNRGFISDAIWTSTDQCVSEKCLYFDGTSSTLGVGGKVERNVERLGEVTIITSGANNSTTNVTVPIGTEVAVVAVAGWVASPTTYFSAGTVTLGGDSMVLGRADNGTDSTYTAVFYLVNPSEGQQTLEWDWSGSSSTGEGANISYSFYKNIDTTTPIRDTGGESNGASSTASTGLMTARTGDMVVAVGSGNGTDVSWTGATEQNENLYNYQITSIAEATPTETTELVATTGSYAASSAIVLKHYESVQTTAPSQLNFDSGLNEGLTIQGWVKANSDGKNSLGQVWYKGPNSFIRVTNEGSDGLADLEASLNLSTTPATLTIANAINLNSWQHIAMTYTDDGDDEISIYIDGILMGTSTNGSGSPTEELSTGNFPVAEGWNTSSNGTDSTSHTVNLPSGIQAGEMLLVFYSNDGPGDTPTFPAGWTKIFEKDMSSSGFTIWEKIADGTEGSTIATTTPSTEQTAHVSVRISGHNNGEVELADTTGTTTQPDSPTLSPTWGSAKTLWLSATGNETPRTFASYPSGYSAGQNINTTVGNSGSAQVAVGYKNNEASSENPGAFQFGSPTSVAQWDAVTLGIRPNTDLSGIVIGGNSDANFHGFIDEFKVYNYERSADQIKTEIISSAGNAGSSASAGAANIKDLSRGLIGYWKMDETSGDITDSSGNNNTLSNFASTPFVEGWFGNGVDLESGSSQYFSENPSTSTTLSNSGNTTITAWIKPESNTAATQFNIGGKWDSGQEGYLLAQYGDEIRMYVGSTSNYVETTSANLTVGNWYHIAGIYDASTQSIKVIINGAETTVSVNGTIPAAITNTGAYFSIGAEDTGSSPNNYYDGVIDNVRIYNRALSPVEVKNIKELAQAPNAYYSFDEGTGTSTVYDLSGNGNDLLMANFDSSAWTKGQYGKALDFDGTDDYVTTYYDSAFDFDTNSFTIGGWIKKPQQPTSSPAGDSTVLNYTGFEGGAFITGTRGAIDFYEIYSTGQNYQITSTRPRSGDYSFEKTGTYSGDDEYLMMRSPDGTSFNRDNVTTWLTFYLYIDDLVSGAQILQINLGAFFSSAIELYYDSNSDLYLNSDYGTSSAAPVTPYQWHKIEIEYDETNLIGTLYVDGVETVNCAIDDSNNTSIFEEVVLGAFDPNNVGVFHVDDMVVSSARLTYDPTVIRMDVAGDGNSTDWDASNGYQEIDEVPDDGDTTYISSSTATNKQLVTLENVANAGIFSENIKAIKTQALLRDTGGASNLATVVRTHSTDYDQGEDIDPGSTYRPLGKVLSTNPNTTSAWTLSELNDLEIGVLNNAAVTTNVTAVSAMILTDSVVANNYVLSQYDNDQGYKIWYDSSGFLNFAIDDDAVFDPDDIATTSTAYDDDLWHYFTFVKDGINTIKIYLDGQEVASDESLTATGSLSSDSAVFTFGSNEPLIGGYFDGLLDEFKIYNYARTPGQMVQDMNAGHPLGGSPVGSQLSYWAFDESGGQTINDIGISNTTGTRGNSGGSDAADPTWKPATNCKINACLDFDGSGDYIDFNDNHDIYDDEDFTITGWFSRGSYTTDNTIIAKKNDQTSSGAGYVIWIDDSTDTLNVVTSDGDGGTDYFSYNTNNTFTDSTWHHFAVVYDGDDGTGSQIYIDGLPDKATSTGGNISALGDLANAVDLRIGSESDDGAPFDGFLDEIKIYGGKLTEEQVRIDMNANATNNFGTGYDEADQIIDTAGVYPILYLPFDENTGTAVYSRGDSIDFANISMTSGTMDWVRGKIGSALDFERDDTEYLDIQSWESSTDVTVEAWIKLESINGSDQSTIVSHDHDWDLAIDTDGTVYFEDYDQSRNSSEALNIGEWYHISVVYDMGNSISIYINGVLDSTYTSGGVNGSDSSYTVGARDNGSINQYFDGVIDDLKVYNYLRTSAQIAYDYNRGAPIAWWQFDECQGTTAHDASGKGNDGTITASTGTSPDNNAAGSCSSGNADEMWNDGTTGKYNASLGFDGLNDYVYVADDNSLDLDSFTLAAWVKPDTIPSSGYMSIISKEPSGGNYFIELNDSDDINCGFYNGISYKDYDFPGVINTGQWQHVACTFDNSANTLAVYVNGKSVGSATETTNPNNNNSPLWIGAVNFGPSQFFDGQIDDVRIYNYALSPAQVLKVMNENAGVRFGPNN